MLTLSTGSTAATAHQLRNSPVPKRPGSSAPGAAPRGQRTLVTPRSRTAASTSARMPPGDPASTTPPSTQRPRCSVTLPKIRRSTVPMGRPVSTSMWATGAPSRLSPVTLQTRAKREGAELVRAAGVDRFGAEIRLLDLPEPSPRPGEVLLGVRACGVGNWDEFVRTGGWDTGARPPMALGVEAAGVVEAVGAGVRGLRPGDAVTTHSLPAGSWAEKFIAAADHVAPVPSGVPMTVAAALPVPALTADQALAARRGARVIATASRADRPLALGAVEVLDYHEPDWPDRVRALTNVGVEAAVNAARAGSADAVRAVRDGGRLATITADLPPAERGIALSDIVVVPDGERLARLISLLVPDAITVAATYPLTEAAAAMARLRQGTHGAAVVLEP